MSGLFDVFGLEGDTARTENAFVRIGFPRNPFREGAELSAGSGPFYPGHIVEELRDVQRWLGDVHLQVSYQPLSLVGNIGAGKTRIIQFLCRHIAAWPAEEKAAAEILFLGDTGYGRASVGGMLVSALERLRFATPSEIPDGVLPLVWAVVASPPTQPLDDAPLTRALYRAQQSVGGEREERALLVSRWLQRAPLTQSQANLVGLQRRIDWEGEVIRVVAQLLRIARHVGVLRTLFLFIDQLEDLFGASFSELRRSRILSDLRGLVDEIDAGTPIGLCLAWTPDFGAASSGHSVEVLFKSKYEALFARMQRRRVFLPLLPIEHAEPFADAWVSPLRDQAHFDTTRQPALSELVIAAWGSLVRSRRLLPGSVPKATPRDLLGALANEVDREAGLVT